MCAETSAETVAPLSSVNNSFEVQIIKSAAVQPQICYSFFCKYFFDKKDPRRERGEQNTAGDVFVEQK